MYGNLIQTESKAIGSFCLILELTPLCVLYWPDIMFGEIEAFCE